MWVSLAGWWYFAGWCGGGGDEEAEEAQEKMESVYLLNVQSIVINILVCD
jgi:hypothetical protein